MLDEPRDRGRVQVLRHEIAQRIQALFAQNREGRRGRHEEAPPRDRGDPCQHRPSEVVVLEYAVPARAPDRAGLAAVEERLAACAQVFGPTTPSAVRPWAA